MFVRCGKIFIVLALVVMLGAHWTLLQTVAWTTMLADNLRSHSVKEAMTETFDGNHPCDLCKAIAAGKQSEKKTEFSFQSQRLEFPLPKENFVLFAPSTSGILPAANVSAESFRQKPPTPPPRGLFV